MTRRRRSVQEPLRPPVPQSCRIFASASRSIAKKIACFLVVLRLESAPLQDFAVAIHAFQIEFRGTLALKALQFFQAFDLMILRFGYSRRSKYGRTISFGNQNYEFRFRAQRLGAL